MERQEASMKPADPIGAVLVIGGGVGGIQAALDLADSGFKVFLVEKQSAIGGVMAGLDKTFPTNDCSMCILSPKLVECGRHLDIEVLTNSELKALEGSPGAFTATIEQEPRLVSVEKCTGCGECTEVCPISVPDAFNAGLAGRKAIHRLYDQAYPTAYAIDVSACRRCGLCAKRCRAGAIDLTMQPRTLEIPVGAVIAVPGFEPFDARLIANYGYGFFPDVMTSMDFERILSASGPYRGRLLRPSDGKEPRRIAWIQCVGSRDTHRSGNGYCSSVCCTCAIKEAVVAKEHSREGLDATVFYIDLRTHGKGFEGFRERARGEGVRFVRSEIHRICQDPSGGLILRFPEDGAIREELYDMVVLSVGMVQGGPGRELAGRLGIDLDSDGFCRTGVFSPVCTSASGVFAAGPFTGPKDIPETVMGASAAAAEAAALLAPARHSLTTRKTYPPEVPLLGCRPRIGVFVCRCGINIGSVVDVPAVRDYAAGLPNVVLAEEALFTCSQDTQRRMRDSIAEHRLNRVVVAACTPRTHEPLFRETLREAGLNMHLFEMANIRDQCSWVHQGEPRKATEKAKDLVRMSVAKARMLEPLPRTSIDLSHSALVVGGGVAGMSCASALAGQGFPVDLVESSAELGGNARRIESTLEGGDVQAFLAGLTGRVCSDPLITVHRNTRVVEAAGFVGNFRTVLEDGDGSREEMVHGAVVIASGGEASEPGEYLYGADPRVFSLLDLEGEIARRTEPVVSARNVVLINCVGSRNDERPYCSRTCCGKSVKLALALRRAVPSANVHVLHRDIRTYGLQEAYYTQARDAGVRFLRYDPDDPPRVEAVDRAGASFLRVITRDPVLEEEFTIDADLVGLATATVPSAGTRELAGLFKVPLNEDGFFLEAHVKLRPVDFATEGVFVCGLAHSPKSIGESIIQAEAAASRAALVLSRDSLEAGGPVGVIDRSKCSACGLCADLCPFGAIEIDESERVAVVNEASCKGCGLCASSCRCGAADLRGFTDGEISAMISTSLAGGKWTTGR